MDDCGPDFNLLQIAVCLERERGSLSLHQQDQDEDKTMNSNYGKEKMKWTTAQDSVSLLILSCKIHASEQVRDDFLEDEGRVCRQRCRGWTTVFLLDSAHSPPQFTGSNPFFFLQTETLSTDEFASR